MAARDRRSTLRSPSSDSTYSRVEFARDFPDDDTCLEWLKEERFPDGIYCKNCEKVTSHYRVKSRPSWSCQSCGNHVHPTAGTVFHKSSTSLHLWFQGIYLMSSTRCGISAKQLGRETGVNYKTALRMFHKIRDLLGVGDLVLSGDVEMDETYLNRSKRNRPWEDRRGGSGPTLNERVIMGAVERGGRIVAPPRPRRDSRPRRRASQDLRPTRVQHLHRRKQHLQPRSGHVLPPPRQALGAGLCGRRRSHSDHRGLLKPVQARSKRGLPLRFDQVPPGLHRRVRVSLQPSLRQPAYVLRFPRAGFSLG